MKILKKIKIYLKKLLDRQVEIDKSKVKIYQLL